MLIMFGARGVITSPARGLFECPSCRVSRVYTLKRVRRFFVFFFIPIVPLRGEKAFVQCRFCRRAFKPSVLESTVARPRRPARVETRAVDPALEGAPASKLLTWTSGDGDSLSGA